MVVRALGAWGGGGCLNCCSPVAKCPKDGVGNGRIMGFGEMGCDLCGASVGRVGMGGLSELLFARCQVSKGWSRQRANYGIWGDGV